MIKTIYVHVENVAWAANDLQSMLSLHVPIDGIQNYRIVIATLFRHFEWGKYQKFPLRYVEIQ